MTNDNLEKDNTNWNSLISDFERLGGVANNIYQKFGNNGRGIFRVNNERKANIFTPASLLIPINQIKYINGEVTISSNSNYGRRIQNFFNYYQKYFSWGGGGKEESEELEACLKILSYEVKKLINQYYLEDIYSRQKGDWEEIVFKGFINARRVKFKKNSVIAPIWELVNHNNSSNEYVTCKDGLGTPEYKAGDGELTFYYGDSSPIKRFLNYGFVTADKIIFSLPFKLPINSSETILECKGKYLNPSRKLQPKVNKDTIIIDGMPLIDQNYKPLPIGYLNQIMRLTGLDNDSDVEDIHKSILTINNAMRQNLLDLLIPTFSDKANLLAKAIEYELELINSENIE